MPVKRPIRCTKWLVGLSAATLAAGLAVPVAGATPKSLHGGARAPGAPGRPVSFLPADKQGFGTAHSRASRVWYTLERGTLSEVYYPNLSTPSTRELQLVVTNGRTFTDVERSATLHQIRLLDPGSLSYEQVDTARSGDYRITKEYVTDPLRDSVLVHIEFRSLTGHPYHVYVAYQPALGNDMDHDTATRRGAVLSAYDSAAASALTARPAFGPSSNGYFGTSDGIADLVAHHRLTHHYESASNGDVVQTAATSLTGLAGHEEMTLALGFGPKPSRGWGHGGALSCQRIRTGRSFLCRRLASLPGGPGGRACCRRLLPHLVPRGRDGAGGGRGQGEPGRLHRFAHDALGVGIGFGHQAEAVRPLSPRVGAGPL